MIMDISDVLLELDFKKGNAWFHTSEMRLFYWFELFVKKRINGDHLYAVSQSILFSTTNSFERVWKQLEI